MAEETLHAPSFLPLYEDADPLLQIDPPFDAFCDGFDRKACEDHGNWLSSSANGFSLKMQATEDVEAGSSESVAAMEVAEGGGECVMADEGGKNGIVEIQEGEQGSVEGEEGEKGLMEDDEGKTGLNEEKEEEEEEAIVNVSVEDTEGRKWLMENSEAKQECLEHQAAPLTEETSKADSPSKGAMADRATETQTFLESIRQKSECRLRILKEVPTVSNLDMKADAGHLKTELEAIEKLDMKLDKLERTCSSTCSSRPSSSLEGRTDVPSVVHYLREERKRLERQAILKRTLEKLDPIPGQNSKHILRNVCLGPRARYFSLTEEEEALVEDILLKPDFLTEEAEGEGSSTSSCISTAFDYVGEDALRMAEIDEKLEQFIEIHSACGTPSLASVSLLSLSKLHNASILNNRNVRSPSIESGATARTEDQRARSISSSIEDYLLERKQSREHQAKVENIDKRLRELMAFGDGPVKLSKEELDALVAQCIKEQNLEMSMQQQPFLCIKTS